MIEVGIVGGSGFTGAELLRLCAGHPGVSVRFATADSQAGAAVADRSPHLAAAYPDLRFTTVDEILAGDGLAGIELVFLALPHGASQALVPRLVDVVPRLVDLAADFRLVEPDLYPAWYGEAHAAPDLLGTFAYGLPELFRRELVEATRVAVPGCYPTTALLTLAPLVRAGAVEPTGIVVDAASGVSGAGRPPKETTTFCAVDEDFTAYGLLDHRHTPEIEQGLRHDGRPAQVLFTPHLAPMNRGILATCYARPTATTSSEDLLGLLDDCYRDEPFVVVSERPPSTKATLGSNSAHVTVRVDPRTGWVVAIGAIDNLVKGASGQALQCANLVLGLDEGTGLPLAGVSP